MTAASASGAAALHRDAFVFDGHNDLVLRLLEGEDPARPTGRGHLDLPRMEAGGLDGGIFAVWVDPGSEDPLAETLRGLRTLGAFLRDADGVRPVLTSADLGAARQAGEVAAVMGVEGAYGVVDDLGAVDRMHAAGARCVTLTWSEPTAWADAAGTEPVHGGLTPFGGRVVERLQELGVLVDVSHASDRTALDVLERARRPVVASHSGCRSVARHPRNLPDRVLEALADGGGLAGVIFFPGYLDAAHGRPFDRLREEGVDVLSPEGCEALAAATRDLPPVGLDAVARHVEHAVDAAGPDAVGLGSDFDGAPSLPEGMDDVADLPRLTERLAARGMEPDTLRAVLGGNFARVLDEALP